MTALVPPDLSGEHFSRLLEVLAPNERDLMAVIESYFDDSGCHDGSHGLTIAGFVFEREHARQMRAEWAAVLAQHDLAYFHMVDFAPGNGPYKHLSQSERIAIQMQLQDVLYRHAAFGFAVSARQADFGELYGYTPSLPNAFSLCCSICLAIVSDWMAFHKHSSLNAAFFFEAGNKHQGDAAALMQRMCVARQDISCSFVSKRVGGGPVQAADMFAWLQNKYLKSHIAGERRLRKDLKAIVENINCTGVILNGWKAERFIDVVTDYKDYLSLSPPAR